LLVSRQDRAVVWDLGNTTGEPKAKHGRCM
jgi:hypothetical protein